MVPLRSNNGRWLRKYKIFFIIGFVILLFQLLLGVHFLELNKGDLIQEEWQPPSEAVLSISRKKTPVATTNATVLHLDGLDFKPECEISIKEAISAIHRARTQKCKQLIANVTCQSLVGNLYPKHITGRCPNQGRTEGKALGCFKDENNYRLLSGYFGVNKKNNSPNYCIQLCLQSGFPFAGVQYSNECFCGNDEPPSTSKLPDSSCNMKCPGDNHATCGGYYTINVYETGISKFMARTALTEPEDADSKPVKIVFLLTLNGRALRQVTRLLKILYNERHYYYIHVDVREDYLFRELLPLERRFPNIRLTRRRFATIWGGATLLEMLLSCMQELLTMPSWHWDFVLNLSESDYPVKMISSLERFLTANKGHNFVKSHGRDTQRFLQKQGLDKTFVECDMRMWRVSDRKLPNGLQMDGGSDWVALSRKFVSYVTATEEDELVTGLKQVFKYTLLPAESFFHTVLRNSHFCHTYIDNNLHVTNWKRKLGCKCQYKHVVDWCGCSPNDFRPEDWTRIQTTSTKQLYFARKFESIINQAVLLKLELWLHGLEKPPRAIPNLNAYWQSVYHHKDLSPTVDDGIMTILSATGRVWIKNLPRNCSVIAAKPLEATSYHLHDRYRYTLMHFKPVTANLTLDIEVAFKPINSTYLIAPSLLNKRLEELIVSSDYDQKEQISRNFPRILSPYSDLVLIYKFAAGAGDFANMNISCLWLDPAGVLVDVTEISLDETPLMGHAKPTVKQPHLPGPWTVKLVYKKTLLGEVNFLITPLEYFSGKIVTRKQVQLIHGGFSQRISIGNYDQFLSGGFSNRSVLKQVSLSNSKKTGVNLQEWIDSLFQNFYIIERVCSVNKPMNVCGIYVEECSKTNWSSFASDPKSAIENLNQTSGTFAIW